jgi:uncharacterized membrane protein
MHRTIPALTAALVSARCLVGQVTFELLPPVPGADRWWAAAVSADGSAIAGGSYVSATRLFSAVRWTAQGIDVSPGQPDESVDGVGISGDGSTVVGLYSGVGMAWRPPTLPVPFASSAGFARDASFDGMLAVGDIQVPFQDGHAVRWHANQMDDVGAGTGTAISADGEVVVGYTSGSEAFRWTAASGLLPLGALPGDGSSYGWGVSADGTVVVGESFITSPSVHRPFRWSSASGMQPLAATGRAQRANRDGSIIVGYLGNPTSPHRPVIWRNGHQIDFLDLLASIGVTPVGVLSIADVSDDGRTLVGTIVDGEPRAWRARIDPIACYANCDGSTAAPMLSVNDFVCFQSAFAAGDAYANCDQSTTPPVLNIADFVCFLSRFAAGCS